MKTGVPLFELIRCLCGTVELMDHGTASHHMRTAYIAASLADELGLADENKARLVLAASVHDLGSLALKRGAAERERPSDAGAALACFRLLRRFKPLSAAAEVVRYCFIPWNFGLGGTGPGGPVPEESHILHLADRAAALAERGGAGLSRKGEILDGAGEIFVPAQVEAFRILAERESFWLDLSSRSLPALLADRIRHYGFVTVPVDAAQLGLFFSDVINFRSPFTAGHSSGVAACAQALAGLAGFAPERQLLMAVAGHAHDLGKLALPRGILEKAGPLSAEETGIIRTHTYHTHRVLSTIPALAEVNEWAALHHERLDGSGYPFRRKAGSLGTGSRIMAVADVFSALSEDRPYRRGLERGAALSIMRNMACGSALDAGLVDLLEKNYGEIEHRRLLSQAAYLARCRDNGN